jgi:hypothetical protein
LPNIVYSVGGGGEDGSGELWLFRVISNPYWFTCFVLIDELKLK